MSTTSAERLHDAVIKHGIMWNDLGCRVAANEGIPFYEAANMVAPLIERKSCYLAVAVALIDLIVEKNDPVLDHGAQLRNPPSADVKRAVTRVRRLPPGECQFCDLHGDQGMMPSHTASDRCESGKRAHCTCSTCF